MTAKIVRYGFVPFMLLGLNGLGFAMVYYGWSYLWLAIPLLGAIATAFLAERILPNHSEWNDDHGDKITNIWHAIVYEIQNINGILLIPVIVWLMPSFDLWPTSWPLIFQVLLAIVLADFALTYLHYLSHRWNFLWRLHAVHHGVSRLYGFNGLVRHPLHQAIDLAIGTSPLVLMGMPIEVAVLLGLAVSVQLVVQHANVAYELGPFRNHLSIGQLHHMHHVNWGTEGDCNFGLFFTVWDKLLGTFKERPSRPITESDMGIDELPNFPKNYIQQVIFPLHYRPGMGAAQWEREQLEREELQRARRNPAE